MFNKTDIVQIVIFAGVLVGLSAVLYNKHKKVKRIKELSHRLEGNRAIAEAEQINKWVLEGLLDDYVELSKEGEVDIWEQWWVEEPKYKIEGDIGLKEAALIDEWLLEGLLNGHIKISKKEDEESV